MELRTRILLVVIVAVCVGVAIFFSIPALRRAAQPKSANNTAPLKLPPPAPAISSAPPPVEATPPPPPPPAPVATKQPSPMAPAASPKAAAPNPHHPVPLRAKAAPLPLPPEPQTRISPPEATQLAPPMRPATVPEQPERVAPPQEPSQSEQQALQRLQQSQQESTEQSNRAEQKSYAAAPPPPPPPPPPPSPPPPPEALLESALPPVGAAAPPLQSREKTGIVDMRVFYATDRNSAGSGVKGASYGPDQNPNGSLAYGSLIVSIPPTHVTGVLESPIFNIKFLENPAKDIVLASVTPESKDEFFADLHRSVGATPRKEVLIFIHGFDTTFEDAARRTAQLSYDLQFGGAPILYSWPSRGLPTPGSYDKDAKNSEWTADHLMQFLLDVQARSGATEMHVIAHSMGSRALLDALAKVGDPKALHFGQVVLAAPDVPTSDFVQQVPRLHAMADRITLYASSRDEALAISQHFNHDPRAGQSAELSIVPPAETIDASAVDTGFLGHSYFGASVLVLKDMIYLIRDGLPAAKRSHLRESFLGPNAYWTFYP